MKKDSLISAFFVILSLSFTGKIFGQNDTKYFKSIMADDNINYFAVVEYASQNFINHPELISNDDEGGIYNVYQSSRKI